MKFTINTKAFNNVLKTVSKAIVNKTSIPILTGVDIIAHDDHLTVIGSDADITIKDDVKPSKDNGLKIMSTAVKDSGNAIALPASFFQKVVKALPEKTMTFETGEDFLVRVSSGNTRFQINGLDGSNYPHLPKISGSKFTLSVKRFDTLVKDVIINASTAQSRPILTGVHFHAAKGWLNAVATDSHRLGGQFVAVKGNGVKFDVNIPAKSLKQLVPLTKGQTQMTVHLMENQAVFQFANLTFYTRLLTGNYPSVMSLIPQDFDTTMTVDTKALHDVIAQTALLSHASRNNVVRMNIGTDGNVKLLAESPDIGTAKNHFTAKVAGKPVKTAFNPDYMLDALKVEPSAKVTIGFNGSLKPFALKTVDDKDAHFIQLVTPVRVF